MFSVRGGYVSSVLIFSLVSSGCSTIPPVKNTALYAVAKVSFSNFSSAVGVTKTPKQQYIADITRNVATARTRLDTDNVIKTLKSHQLTQDRGKWGAVALAGLTTVLGTVGSNQTNKKDWLTYTTAGVGSLTTIFIAMRDDKDIQNRIDKCQDIAKNGNKIVDIYESKWYPTAESLPDDISSPANQQQVQKFLQDFLDDSKTLFSTVDGMTTDCH